MVPIRKWSQSVNNNKTGLLVFPFVFVVWTMISNPEDIILNRLVTFFGLWRCSFKKVQWGKKTQAVRKFGNVSFLISLKTFEF